MGIGGVSMVVEKVRHGCVILNKYYMKHLLKLEELAELILAAYLATLLPYAWW